MRQAVYERKTKETSIHIKVNLDGSGVRDISTGIGFLDHMLDQLSRHSLIDMTIKAQGDLHIDDHHTTEDVGWALGHALSQALGKREGITRYGCAYVPMDEALTRVVVDCSNRPFLVFDVLFPASKVGQMDTELFEEWFRAFSQSAGLTLHVQTLYGTNAHHMVESCYKGLALALRQAIKIDQQAPESVPSTKGVLGGSMS